MLETQRKVRYRIQLGYEQGPKCPYCDEKREYTFVDPRGNSHKITCECSTRNQEGFYIERCLLNGIKVNHTEFNFFYGIDIYDKFGLECFWWQWVIDPEEKSTKDFILFTSFDKAMEYGLKYHKKYLNNSPYAQTKEEYEDWLNRNNKETKRNMIVLEFRNIETGDVNSIVINKKHCTDPERIKDFLIKENWFHIDELQEYDFSNAISSYIRFYPQTPDDFLPHLDQGGAWSTCEKGRGATEVWIIYKEKK